MDKIRIVAAILDTEKLVLYKDDGLTVEVKQGDPRVQRIIDQVTEPLSTQGWADVSLEIVDPDVNVYREFENLVKGAIRFFRVHKDKLSTLFDTLVEDTTDNGAYGQDRHLKPVSLGTVPGATVSPPGSMSASDVAAQEEVVSAITPIAEAVTESDEPTEPVVQDATQNQKPTIQEATAQIMASAQSVSDPKFVSGEHNEQRDTMIAAVKDASTGKLTIIPGMENLQAQFARAVKLGSAKGAENFIKRIAAVIGERKHTIDELLNFMSKGDLPIADDGSILAYKVLTTGYGEKKGYFVDCHTKSVQQRVGSFVRQLHYDESRRTQCSTGLHIARRGYLSGFPGNAIVLVKVAPEDVIAVPLGEPDKMRARGYHIVSSVPDNEHATLRANRPLEGTEAKKLLAMAIAGDHIDVIEEVVIGGPKGTQVKAVAKPIEEVKVAKPPKPHKKTAEAEVLPDETKKHVAPPVDVKKTSDAAVTAKTESRTDKATRLLAVVNGSKNSHSDRRQAALDLQALKKQTKISWDKLGLDANDVEEVARLANSEEKADKVEKTSKTAPKTTPKATSASKPASGTKEKRAPAATPSSVPAASSTAATPAKEPSRQDKAKALLNTIEKGKTKQIRRQAYQDLIALKKTSKVGWGQLGVKNFDAIQAKFEGK